MRDLSLFHDAHLRIFDRPTVPPPAEIENVYLIGICGTGMGSLAGLFQQAGHKVTGSDVNVYPPMSTRLQEMGIEIKQGFKAENLLGETAKKPDLLIVGNMYAADHVEAAVARDNNFVQQSFPEALAHFFIQDRRSLVVAGTHGKTTTTGLMAHVFDAAGRQPGFLVGGVMTNRNVSYQVGSGNHFIVEGDEYDCSYFDKRPKFLHYRPMCGVVTSMEFDHADIYADWDEYRTAFEEFADYVNPEGLLILHGDDQAVRDIAKFSRANVIYYGLDHPGNNITANNIQPITDNQLGGQQFDLVIDGKFKATMMLPMSGKHNLRNALSVCAVALHEGLSLEEISAGLKSFGGMKRRQEVIGVKNDVVILDDFAHHPTAVRETLKAIKERWPARRLVAVFEPRSNSSRRKIFQDAYAQAFDCADAVFLSVPPFRFNDRREDFIDIDVLMDHIQQTKPVSSFENADQLLPELVNFVRPNDVVLIMSNGAFGNLPRRLLDAI